MRPLVLLDVDGVLNALSHNLPDTAVWPRWQRGFAATDGMSWPIVFSLDVIERLRRWHEDGLVELQWLTTWGHSANGELRELLGLPDLEVAGTYQDEEDDGSAAAVGGVSHAAVAPSAPDPLSGRWWKYDVVRRLLDAHPGRVLIWVDDELHDPGSPYRAWADAQPRVQAVGPDPARGLSPADLDLVAQHLPAREEAGGERCRSCGGRVLPIAYGFPGPGMWEAAERGELVLGGCCPTEASSRCASCGTEASGGKTSPWA